MAITETRVSFHNRQEEINRVKGKNNKDRLAETIVKIHDIVLNEKTTDSHKVEAVRALSSAAYY